MIRIVFLALLLSLNFSAQGFDFEEIKPLWRLPHIDQDKHQQKSAKLGKQLFFDKNLSLNRRRSCASCHIPEKGWSDGLALAEGIEGKPLTRSTPSIINTAYQSIQMWDGRVDTLEQQAMLPILAPREMGLNRKELLKRVLANPNYRRQLSHLYPNQKTNNQHISQALADFQRTVILNNSRFDQWLQGNDTAISSAAVRGFKLFVDPKKGNCMVCHLPPNFSDDGFHNIGVTDGSKDPGRYQLVPLELMKGAFKTPSLRGIASTAPYFHNGSAKSLAEVVEHYIKAGQNPNGLSPSILPINLSNSEKQDLVEFLKSLSP